MNRKDPKDVRTQKQEQFAEAPAQPKSSAKIAISLAAAVLAAILIYMVFAGNSQSTASVGTTVGEVRIPLSEVSDGTAKFYNYTASNNKSVRFFVIKSSDGQYRAAADACDVCYRAKLGYYQEGDDMVCKKCGQRFPSLYVNEVRGGCNPAGVPTTVRGNELVISASQLEAQSAYF
ncbi:MAG: Fe-S-containing protein [Terriglobales bacterium]